MQEKLVKRLSELKTEFASGQKLMADLEAKQANLRDTLLRISGAIQVLEELINSNIEHNGQVSEELESVQNSQ
jgi:ABC-type transporter Mla subunit MlaD